jgi:hypothetical protein
MYPCIWKTCIIYLNWSLMIMKYNFCLLFSGVIAGGVTGGLVIIFFISACCYYCCCYRGRMTSGAVITTPGNIIVLLRDVFHICLVIVTRPEPARHFDNCKERSREILDWLINKGIITWCFSYWPSDRSSVCCIGVRLRLRPIQQASDL